MDLNFKQDISFFKMIFNQMAEGFVIQDSSYAIIDFNQSALDILGLSSDQLLGKTSMDPSWKTIRENGSVFKGEEHPAVVAINKGIKVQDIMGVYKPNGEISWILINASPVFNEQKKVIYCICSFRDITAEKKSKDDLDVLATRLNLALEIAEIGIWDFDIVNQKLIWDDRMFEVYGAKRENFTSEYEAWVNCLLPEEKIAGDLRVQEAIANKTGLDFKFKIKTIYGEIRTIVAKGKVVCDANGNAVRLVGANWNITNSEKVKEQLEQASRAKMVFLANTGHEIRTPLNGIIGSIDILRDSKLDHEQKELVETIHTCGDNLLKLLNDVLDLSKFESGKIEIVKSSFNLENIVSNANKLFNSIAQAKNLKFIFENNLLKKQIVFGDEVKINQVINNFLNNAIKFTDKGHVKFSASQTVGPDKIINLILKFNDTGIGIDQDNQKKIFTPFEQLDPSITRKFGGTGLGLSISKNIVDLMGGKVSIESTLGVGTTFIVELPLEISTEKVDEEKSLESFEKFKNLNVLIVEDNEINLKILCKLLDKIKVKNTSAISGHIAIELCKKNDFDLILMDLQMPGIDGFETTLKIFELNKSKKPKVVALSANMQIDEKDKCLNYGMLAFYQKPVTKESLVKILMNHSDD